MFRVRILPGYVFQEFSKTFILAFLAVIIVLFVSFGYKQVSVQKGLDFVSVFSLLPFIMAKAMPYALPFGMVCACTLAYGRLAGDNEIDAMRTSGIHLHCVITPVLAFGLLASVATYAADDLLSPMLGWQSERIQDRVLRTIVQRFSSIGSPTYSWEAGADEKIHLYVDDIEGDELRGVVVYLTEKGRITQTIMAESGRLRYYSDGEKRRLVVVIRSGTVKNINPQRPARINIVPARIGGNQETHLPYDLETIGKDVMSDPAYRSTMQNQRKAGEYREKITEARRRLAELDGESAGGNADEGETATLESVKRKKLRDRAERDIRNAAKDLNETLIEIYGRLALATSCFFLALVAVPLSIVIRRGHMLVAFLVGLLLVVAYMVTFLVGGKFLGMGGYLHPGLAVWAPNVILLIVGACLMLKVFRA